jgi:hypothetical protein
MRGVQKKTCQDVVVVVVPWRRRPWCMVGVVGQPQAMPPQVTGRTSAPLTEVHVVHFTPMSACLTGCGRRSMTAPRAPSRPLAITHVDHSSHSILIPPNTCPIPPVVHMVHDKLVLRCV